jgi:Tfp pilus assembly protein PilF
MRSIRLHTVVFLLSATLSVRMVSADVVHLKDGTKIEGSVHHSDDGWVVRAGAKTIHVHAQDVESIELTPTTNPSPQRAGEYLASLRRSVEGLSDLNEIIGRFQRFVDTSNDPSATADAKKDLVIWQDRAYQKMVKVGSKWVTPAQRDSLVDQAGANADLARQYMKQGRSKEAEPLLVDVISIDPTNATALYLTGLLRYQQEQLAAARKAFEGTAMIIPNHAPTLNNLGVIEWRQHQYIAALQNFDAAMLSSPVNKTVLDNLAVALQNVPVDLQKSPVTTRVIRHFNEQDQKLAERMSHDGMHRFGSLWLSDHDLDQMKADEKVIQDKLDALAGDFDHTKDHIAKLDGDIADDQTDMQRMAANSYVTDPRSGTQVQVPLPSAYYDAQRDQEKKNRERQSEVNKLDSLKKQAQDLQNSRPSIRSQGVMQVIGTEGTPIKIAGPAAK